MNKIALLLDNQDVQALDGVTFDRLNPITGDVASRAAAAQIADAQRAADTAAAAFPGWAATGPGARRDILLKAADRLSEATPRFIELMAAETGATAGWAGFNVFLAANMLREAAAMTTQISGEVIPSDKPNTLAMAIRQPAGVVLSIAPWNAPVILGVRAVALPLACGNTVILKASEVCPGTHRLIAECLRDAGLPPGVLNVLTNAPEDAPGLIDALIGHPAVRRVNFTGSTRVGRLIAQTAAKYLKPVLLELDREMEEAAATLGASPARTLRSIVLPNILPALASGTGLAFAKALGEFGSVVLISGNLPFHTEVASVYVFGLIESDRRADACAVSMVLIAVSIGLLSILDALRRRSQR